MKKKERTSFTRQKYDDYLWKPNSENLNYDAFFKAFEYKTLRLRNRFVMAPMTRAQSPEGIPDQRVADYYGRRAAAEVGLILTEGTVVDRPASKNLKDIPDFHGKSALQGWSRVLEAVHRQGGKIGPQIWHVGNSSAGWAPPVPFEHPDSMTPADIENTIMAFADAARSAAALGFDVVEIHGAHGYLIDQFFWQNSNHRTDQYGGATIQERVRFGVDLVKAIRKAVGPDMPLIMRISQWKGQDYNARIVTTPQELENWVSPLANAGVDIFHASQRRYWIPEFEGSDLNFAGWIKKITGRPTITVGSVGLDVDFMDSFRKGAGGPPTSLDDLLRRFDRGDFDLIAVGRQLLQDPEWVRKVKEHRLSDIQSFDSASLRVYH